MNDKDTALRTTLLMPELDACAAAAARVEELLLAIESVPPAEHGGRPRELGGGMEVVLLRAERVYQATLVALRTRTRELGLERGAAATERERERIARDNEQNRLRMAEKRRQAREPGGRQIVSEDQRAWGNGSRVYEMAGWEEDGD